MKRVWFAVILSFGVGFVHAQREHEQQSIQVLEIPEPGCIIWPALPEIETTLNFNVDEAFRREIVQPTSLIEVRTIQTCEGRGMGVLSEANNSQPYPLNQDLPLINTLHGTVFTFDYLRPSVR